MKTGTAYKFYCISGQTCGIIIIIITNKLQMV